MKLPRHDLVRTTTLLAGRSLIWSAAILMAVCYLKIESDGASALLYDAKAGASISGYVPPAPGLTVTGSPAVTNNQLFTATPTAQVVLTFIASDPGSATHPGSLIFGTLDANNNCIQSNNGPVSTVPGNAELNLDSSVPGRIVAKLSWIPPAVWQTYQLRFCALNNFWGLQTTRIITAHIGTPVKALTVLSAQWTAKSGILAVSGRVTPVPKHSSTGVTVQIQDAAGTVLGAASVSSNAWKFRSQPMLGASVPSKVVAVLGELSKSKNVTRIGKASTIPSTPIVTITSTPMMKGLNAGGDYSYQVVATDSKSLPIRYSLGGAPSDMNIDPSSGLITWKATQPGTFQFSAVATDSQGIGKSQLVTITVCTGSEGDKWMTDMGGMCM